MDKKKEGSQFASLLFLNLCVDTLRMREQQIY
jgi:hypothetical protein